MQNMAVHGKGVAQIINSSALSLSVSPTRPPDFGQIRLLGAIFRNGSSTFEQPAKDTRARAQGANASI